MNEKNLPFSNSGVSKFYRKSKIMLTPKDLIYFLLIVLFLYFTMRLAY